MAHPLSGANPGTLVAAMRCGGTPDRWAQALAIGASVMARSPLSALERALVDRRLPRVEEMEPPIFILGHWRSGTTHLYNIMSLGGFGYVPPLAAGLPWDMFGLARTLRRPLEGQLPETRFIDNIPVTPESPQEDEIAIANMSTVSFYHGLYFPRSFDRLIDRGLFFDGCTETEIEAWVERFTYLMRKLSLQSGRRLLIKNPVYTARPALLRRLFPGAKFIHIHRNPFDVFLSMRNFYARLLEVMALQDVPAELDIDATILRVYARMMESFTRETADWDAPDFVELPYARLDAAPMEAMAEIYERLDLPGYDAAAPTFERYLRSVRNFRKNDFRGNAADIEKVQKSWRPWLERWGYAGPESVGA